MFEIANRLISEALAVQEAVLLEGINDKYIFKAVFLAGGGGSGKSFVAEKAFSNTGARFINSDSFFEYRLVKNNLPQIIASPPPDFSPDPSMSGVLGGAAVGIAAYVKAQQTAHRARAKELASKTLELSIKGMLPLIIDGTGRDIDKMSVAKKDLEGIGYDTSILFVNTTLEVSLERNRSFRARTVPEDDAVKAWHQVQKNIPKYKTLFGGKMVMYDNSANLTPAEVKRLSSQLASISRKLLEKPVMNPLGREIISTLRKEGGKYLADLPAAIAAKVVRAM